MTKWMRGAVKKPGALRSKAKAAGELKPNGNISRSWELKESKKPGKIGKEARLARTFNKTRPKGKKK